jgi:hypothetical protein
MRGSRSSSIGRQCGFNTNGRKRQPSSRAGHGYRALPSRKAPSLSGQWVRHRYSIRGFRWERGAVFVMNRRLFESIAERQSRPVRRRPVCPLQGTIRFGCDPRPRHNPHRGNLQTRPRHTGRPTYTSHIVHISCVLCLYSHFRSLRAVSIRSHWAPNASRDRFSSGSFENNETMSPG